MHNEDASKNSEPVSKATQIEVDKLKKRIRDLLESKSLPQEFLSGLRAGLEGLK